MPAPSFPIGPVIGHLAAVAADAGEDPPGLLAALAGETELRCRRGVRHRRAVIRPSRRAAVASTAEMP